MLSSLPPELLRQIIESTVPSAYHSSTYRSRQTTLCILSLISHRFRQIAQPLLRQVIYLPTKYGTAHAAAERILKIAGLQGWDENVRQLIMYIEDDRDKSVIRVDQVVLACPRLAELTMSNHARDLRQTELSAISRLSELRSLQIDYYDLNPVHLPGLETLTMSDVRVQNGDLKSFLQPSMLPSLRALGIIRVPRDQLLDLLCDPSSLLLLHHIDALFVKASIFDNSDAILCKMQPFLSKTLVHLAADDISTQHRRLSPLPHLRLDISDSCGSLAKFIQEEDHSSLKSLYLAIPRQASQPRGSQREQDRISLLAICSARKVEVIEEEQPCHWDCDPFISPKFWRRQRELKRSAGVQ